MDLNFYKERNRRIREDKERRKKLQEKNRNSKYDTFDTGGSDSELPEFSIGSTESNYSSSSSSDTSGGGSLGGD